MITRDHKQLFHVLAAERRRHLLTTRELGVRSLGLRHPVVLELERKLAELDGALQALDRVPSEKAA